VTDANRYPAQVFWSDEDGGFIAIAPDLPGCSSFGETQQEALSELQDAILAWIEAARTAGNPIPEPSDPAKDSEYSGKLLLRMPRELHARLAGLAKFEAVSLNQFAVYLLTWASTYRSIGNYLPVAGPLGTISPGPAAMLHPVVAGTTGTSFDSVLVNTSAEWQISTYQGGRTPITFHGGGLDISTTRSVTAKTGGAFLIKELKQGVRHG
jgi:predicted RNase H-like HicB family nuclease